MNAMRRTALPTSSRPRGAGRYLLLAATRPEHEPGRHGVRAAFAKEAEAREAFVALRLSPAYRHGWAEVLGVGDSGQAKRLCWFGDRSSDGVRDAESAPEGSRPARRLRRLLASLAVLAVLTGAGAGCRSTDAAEEHPVAITVPVPVPVPVPDAQVVPYVPPSVEELPGAGMDG